MSGERCEETGKVIYTSEHAARRAIGIHGKRMRVYRCPEHKAHFHTSKVFHKELRDEHGKTSKRSR